MSIVGIVASLAYLVMSLIFLPAVTISAKSKQDMTEIVARSRTLEEATASATGRIELLYQVALSCKRWIIFSTVVVTSNVCILLAVGICSRTPLGPKPG